MSITKIGLLNWYLHWKEIRKIPMIPDIENWLWMTTNSDFFQVYQCWLKVQKSFQCNFRNQWNIGFIMKNFYQILLTPWKTYDQLCVWNLHGKLTRSECASARVGHSLLYELKRVCQILPWGHSLGTFF